MLHSFRSRLIAVVITLVVVTAGAVAVVAYVLVRDSLRDQLVADAVDRAEFNINVLAGRDQLPVDAGLAEFEDSGLAERFLLRGTGGVYVEFPQGDSFASEASLLGADAELSPELRPIVERGEFAFEFLEIGDTSSLVVAARRPPAGPDFFFFDSAEDVDSAISQLARFLLIAGAGVIVLGALAAGLIARRVLRPVGVAADAATAMAGGDLTVRVPTETSDELGSLAVAFNKMATSLEGQIGALVAAHERERRFVADVSHELRTPLTALVNEAGLLRNRLESLPADDRRIGDMLVTDVARLRSLVEDLLEVSRLQAGSVPQQTGVIDVSRFLEAVIAERNPEARLVIDEPDLRVETDRHSLERIFGNLLDNARHHAPDSAVRVGCRMEDDRLLLEVADNGPGVPSDALEDIFDRFYKTDASRQGGSGLGLAIAREHARRLDGDLVARRGSSGGLVFTLQIPVTVSLHSGDVAEKSVSEADGEEDLTRRTP